MNQNPKNIEIFWNGGKKFRNGIHRPQGELNFVVLYIEAFPYKINPACNCQNLPSVNTEHSGQNFTIQESTHMCTQHNPV